MRRPGCAAGWPGWMLFSCSVPWVWQLPRRCRWSAALQGCPGWWVPHLLCTVPPQFCPLKPWRRDWLLHLWVEAKQTVCLLKQRVVQFTVIPSALLLVCLLFLDALKHWNVSTPVTNTMNQKRTHLEYVSISRISPYRSALPSAPSCTISQWSEASQNTERQIWPWQCQALKEQLGLGPVWKCGSWVSAGSGQQNSAGLSPMPLIRHRNVLAASYWPGSPGPAQI